MHRFRSVTRPVLAPAAVLLAFAVASPTAGCESTSAEPEPTASEPADPLVLPTPAAVAPAMRRLSQAQYRQAIAQAFGPGVVVPPGLEVDVESQGSLAVGLGEATISRRGVEQFEQAAFTIAEQAVTSPVRDAWVPCEAGATSRDDACARAALSDVGETLWRQPVPDAELEPLVAIAGHAADKLGAFDDGLAFGLAGLLQAPQFLFRVELGAPAAEADADAPPRARTPHELASVLSYLLWDAAPDAELLEAADSGALATDAGLAEQFDRLWADPRAKVGVRALFDDVLGLRALAKMQKEASVFPHATADLGASAREETLLGVEHLLFEGSGDYRELFTTRRAFVNRTLAAIYDVPAPDREGFAMTWLPTDGPRAGFLGQVSFLAAHSHATSTSATLRGVFVREHLLCGHVPIPPSNVNTGLPEPSPELPTLRDRSAVHLENPACAGCHLFMDPIGLGFEQFDGLGRYRTLEQGHVIDPSGDLDGAAFDDARQLGQLVAGHPELGRCFVKRTFRRALGRMEAPGEAATLEAFAARFADADFHVPTFLRDLVLSPAFRALGDPEPAPDTETPEGAE